MKPPVIHKTRNFFILGKHQKSFASHRSLNLLARQSKLSGPESSPDTVLIGIQRNREESVYLYLV